MNYDLQDTDLFAECKIQKHWCILLFFLIHAYFCNCDNFFIESICTLLAKFL